MIAICPIESYVKLLIFFELEKEKRIKDSKKKKKKEEMLTHVIFVYYYINLNFLYLRKILFNFIL